ncbi:hypothetical protein [uncultured Bilophila sp.]|uniref:hypothetical protein n=1 Tax=uncultured Bilophila sp. TaxID=529385 RepID=UPI0026094582|nr:hypothetical protein [uncultured Bilophila sp.]
MTLSKGAIGNLINRYRAVLKKCRMMNVFGSLAVAGLLVAGSAGSAGSAVAEDVYYYAGVTATEAASDAANWEDASGGTASGVIGKTEGTPTEYRFLPGTYDGSKTSAAAWVIGANGDIRIVSDGPITIQKWGQGMPPNQGVITARNGSITFGDDVTVRDNYSSGASTGGGGAIYSDRGITFGDNASLIHNMTAKPISGPYNGGGAIFLNATPDAQLVFGKNALLERNEANYGGAIYSLGSVSFGEGAIIRNNRAPSQGGALRVTGTLTLNPGSLVEGNKADGSKTYGGAVFLEGTGNVTGTTFTNNTAVGGNGGAVYLQGGGTLHLADGSLMEGNEASLGGAVLANKSGVDVNDTSFLANKAANGGALCVLTGTLTVQQAGGENGPGTLFQDNTASAGGGAIYTSGPVTIGDGTRLEGNQADKGGGLYVYGDGTTSAIVSGALFKENTASTSGGAIHASQADVTLEESRLEGNQGNLGGALSTLKSNLTITDATFINNTAVQGGGALFVQDGSLLFRVTKTSATPLISGNTAGAAGGFLYLSRSDATFDVAEGAQLQIGDALYAGNDAHMDSLGIMSSGSMKKTGAGELRINSVMDELLGTVGVEAGTMSVGRHWEIKNAVSVTGGTLDLPSFSFSGDDGKLTISGGTLMTATGQIFETALNAEGSNEDVGGVKADVDAHMNFDSGLIAFNDAKYNLEYAGSAAAALGVSPGQEPGQTAEKEITFTGELYTPPLNPVMNFAMLQKAVREDGLNEIIFGDDIVLESRLQGSTPIERELSIDGRGHTLSGAHPAFWFADMSTGTISIVNITFDGLKSDKNDKYDQPVPFAPAVYFNMGDWKSEAVLRIGDGVTFKNNESVPDSAGGAVRTAQGIVAIGDDVTFQNNTSGAGGGLYSESFTTIGDRVVFEGNQARRGGALDVIDDYEGYAGDPDYLNGTRKVKYVHIGKDAVFKDNKAIFDFGGNGGAIEVQSGELSIDDGAVFTGNTSNNTGGAISICNWSPQLPGKVELGQVSFIKNQATYGGAIINEGSLSLKGMASFESNSAASGGGGLYNSGTATFADHAVFSENTAANGGAILNEGEASFSAWADFSGNTASGAAGAIYNSGTTSFEADATFSNNSAVAGGAILNEGNVSFAGPTDFSENTADTAGGGAIYNTNVLTFADGAVFKDNATTGDGGAIYNDAAANQGTIVSEGDIRFNGGAFFTGNKADGLGGAVYNLYDVTLNPGMGQEILFRGNTDSTGANAIHMAAGSHLDVTGAGTVKFDDPLSFADASPTVNKSGEGDLLFNAAMDGFLGTFEQEDGVTKVTSDWNIKNAVTLSGGTLELPSFSFADPDADGHVTGGLLTIAGGTLVTATGQIFETALNAEGDNEDVGGVKADVDAHMDFDSGLIAFNDAKYNLKYAGSAAAALGVSYGEEPGQTAEKEITFTGDLYTPGPDPDPDPGPGPDPDPGPNPDPDPGPGPDPDPGPNPDPDPGPGPDPDPGPNPGPDPQPEPEPTPTPSTTVTIKDLNDKNITNVVLGNVTIATATDPAAGKNLIIGSDGVDDQRFSDAEALPGSIGSRDIVLGAEGSGVAVVGGHYLTLVGGDASTSLISAGSGGEKPVDVLVGGSVNGQASEGTLNLGTQAMSSGGTLKGNVQLAASSTLNVRAGEFTLTGESETPGHSGVGVANGGGTLNVADGATLHASIRQASGETNVAGRLESDSVELQSGKLTVSGAADIGRLAQHGGETEVSGTLKSEAMEANDGVLRVIGTLKTDSLDAASALRIEVGDENAAGKLHVASTSLGGAGLFLDPAWRGNDTLEEASHGVVNFRNQTVDGRLAAGRNALLVLGDASADWTLGVFDASGLRWGPEGVTAALSVRTPQRLDPGQGALAVDGSLTSAPSLTPNTAFFGDSSLFMVDASGLKGDAALTAQGGTLTVADTASLLLGNVTEGEYVITSGFTDNAGVLGWEGDFLITPDQLIALALDKGEAGIVKVRATALDAGDVLPGLALRSIVNEVWGTGRNDVNSSNMGIRFLSRAVNEDYLSRGAAADVIDGAAQIAVAGGVQGTALLTASAPVRAVQDHASLSRSVARKGGDVRGEGINLWIDALYGANRARNLGAGSLDGGYNADFGGVVFGGDVGAGPFRVGVALDAGGGTARSRGDFASTKNDFDFWGIALYGTWTRDRFNLMADAGYSEGSHEVRQNLPASLRLGQLKADVDTRVVTAGLRAEYLIPTVWADVMPHIGARYAALTTDGFSSHIEDEDVFHISRDTQHIWTFPVGVTFGKDVQTESGWKVKPRVDLSVVPAAGDTKARTRARVSDVAASDTVRSRIVDATAFDGSVGLELEKDNISLSLNCGVQASEHQTGQNVALSFTYKF